MSARVLFILAVALPLAALNLSCGGSDENKGRLSLSKAEFVKRANSACRKARADLQGEVLRFVEAQESGKPPQIVNADLAHFVLLPPIEVQIWQIEQILQGPGIRSRDEKRVDRILDLERLAVDESATTLRFPSRDAVFRKFARSAKLFRAYGLQACANGPAPPRGLRL